MLFTLSSLDHANNMLPPQRFLLALEASRGSQYLWQAGIFFGFIYY